MNAVKYWELFLATGAPEAYLLYNRAKRMEQAHVSGNQSACTASHRLQ